MRGSSLLVDRTLGGIANEWGMVSTRSSSPDGVVFGYDGGTSRCRWYSPQREVSAQNEWLQSSTRSSSPDGVVFSYEGGTVHSRGYSPQREASSSNER
jgi:uncharacterized protein YodC (DUF2158 family)